MERHYGVRDRRHAEVAPVGASRQCAKDRLAAGTTEGLKSPRPEVVTVAPRAQQSGQASGVVVAVVQFRVELIHALAGLDVDRIEALILSDVVDVRVEWGDRDPR